MDFAPGEDCLALQRLASDFARREILPVTEAIDRERRPEARLPADILARGSRLGLRTLSLPENGGGGGADILTLCFVAEELGWGDLGVGVIHAQDWALANAISRLWDGAEFRAFANRFARDHGCHLSHAHMRETPAPEDKSPYPSGERPDASVTREGDGWRLHGAAGRVLNGAAAGFFLIESNLRGAAGRRVFLVENEGAPEIRVLCHHDSMGMRSCPDVDIRFEGARLQRRHQVDCSPEAWREATHAARILPAAAAIGTARKSNEHALRHARERVQGGKPIIGHQTVGFMLCDNLAELDAARRSLQAAAWAADRGEGADPWRSFLVRALVTETCERVARRAMEVWGGAGYMTEAPMERLLRDLVRFSHSLEMGHALRAAAMGLI